MLAAAVHLLLGAGAGRVTHRSVAEEAGSSLSAIRYYFRTREDLLAACLGEIDRVRSAEAERMLEQASRPAPPDAERTAEMALRVSFGPDLRDAAVAGVVWCVVDCARQGPALATLLGRHRQAATRQMQHLLRAQGYAGVSASLAAAVLDGSVMTAAVEARIGIAETAIAELAAVLRPAESSHENATAR